LWPEGTLWYDRGLRSRTVVLSTLVAASCATNKPPPPISAAPGAFDLQLVFEAKGDIEDFDVAPDGSIITRTTDPYEVNVRSPDGKQSMLHHGVVGAVQFLGDGSPAIIGSDGGSYIFPPGGGDPKRVDGGGYGGAFTKDGATMVFLGANRAIFMGPIDGSAQRTVLPSNNGCTGVPTLAPDNKHLLCNEGILDIDSAAIVKTKHIPRAASPDGQRIVFLDVKLSPGWMWEELEVCDPGATKCAPLTAGAGSYHKSKTMSSGSISRVRWTDDGWIYFASGNKLRRLHAH
jgi:hypothetical protein